MSNQHDQNGKASGNRSNAKDPLYNLLDNTGRPITYWPFLRQLVGDINATLLLQQIIFWFINKKHEKFYKFVEPSSANHPAYREGDSWTEELQFSRDEYNVAIKKIGTRVRRHKVDTILGDTEPVFGPDTDKRRKGKQILVNRAHLVAYWREADNKMWFQLNERLLVNAIQALYNAPTVDNPLSGNGKGALGDGDSVVSDQETPDTYNIEHFRENTINQVYCLDDCQKQQSVEAKKENLSPAGSPKGSHEQSYEDAISLVWKTNAPAVIA